jgi:ATP-dependent helicase/nuclease subunit A
MYEKFTNEQKNAVRAKGSVVVTAAAGSGKTAVLTERVIDKVKNENLSLDRLLIVTFTNLAAAEMKTRIEKRLFEECEKHPQNIHLLKQKLLVSSADICTIDSFCIKLIRNNFSKLGINPDFKIADTKTELVVSKKVMAEIFKEHYDAEDKDFYEFLRSTDSIYSDENAISLILTLYNKIMTLPFYIERLDNMLLDFNPDKIKDSK